MLDGDDLKSEVAEGECTNVHFNILAIGKFIFAIDCSDATIGTIPCEVAEVHIYKSWLSAPSFVPPDELV